MEELARAIEERIKDLKVAKTTVAQLSGISSPTLYAIMDREDVMLSTAIKVCRTIGIGVDEILGLREVSKEKVLRGFLEQEYEMKKARIKVS